MRPGAAVDHRLTAYAHQARAFSAVRQAAISGNADEKALLLDRAEDDSAKAVEAMRRGGWDRPSTWVVTTARISIERGLLSEAREALLWVMENEPDEPEPYALAAAVMTCLGEPESEVAELLAQFSGLTLASGDSDPRGFAEYRRITQACKVERG